MSIFTRTSLLLHRLKGVILHLFLASLEHKWVGSTISTGAQYLDFITIEIVQLLPLDIVNIGACAAISVVLI